jgi:hypothetical protein
MNNEVFIRYYAEDRSEKFAKGIVRENITWFQIEETFSNKLEIEQSQIFSCGIATKDYCTVQELAEINILT